MRCRDFLFISLVALLLTACASSTQSGDLNPIVDDPDININVTPQPDQKYAYFTVVVTRIGEQSPKIGWRASGEIYLRVALDVDGPLNVVGTGFGTAGFDASSNACKDAGGWPVDYTAEGYFNKDNCELTIKVEETWPKTEAQAVCLGRSGSASGGIYKLTFPGLNFKDDDPREDTTTSKDLITWLNTFLLYPKSGLEDTGCVFEAFTP
jgi:hypothetical protein